jgi:hypothetical protein
LRAEFDEGYIRNCNDLLVRLQDQYDEARILHPSPGEVISALDFAE